MRSNDTVILMRVGNGFMVMPEFEPGMPTANHEKFVFQDKGYVSAARDNQPTNATLFGWLDEHFTLPTSPAEGLK